MKDCTHFTQDIRSDVDGIIYCNNCKLIVQDLFGKATSKYYHKHGGKRQNAGRKSQYKEETQTISFRVPKSLIEPITKYVKRALAKSKK